MLCVCARIEELVCHHAIQSYVLFVDTTHRGAECVYIHVDPCALCCQTLFPVFEETVRLCPCSGLFGITFLRISAV